MMTPMTATTTLTSLGGLDQAAPPDTALTYLWDPASGRFHPTRLRRALIVRGWSPHDLAREAGISRTTAYKALSGTGVLDKMAYKIVLAIQQSEPRLSDAI